jgi:hypothetical protein
MVTKDPAAVEVEVQAAYRAMFPDGDAAFVPEAFGWLVEAFRGGHPEYQPVDAPYHDLEHTLQGTLCMALLLRGRHRAGVEPRLTEPLFRLGLAAILTHDSGYLKRRGDTEGTGAKYTITHVDRSASFAADLLASKGFSAPEIQAVRNMIHCTGVDAALQGIPFGSEEERMVGYALGTADLLGQMAAPDYVEKLPALFAEFDEAARHAQDKSHFVCGYSTAADLMSKTPSFWERLVRVKLNGDFGGMYRFLNDPYPDGPNPYLRQIEANMSRLRRLAQPACS